MSKFKKISSKATTILLVGVMAAGLILLLYPTFANWWNSRVQTTVLNEYNDYVADLSNEEYDRILAEARQYNEDWKRDLNGRMVLSEAEKERYKRMLIVPGSDVMGSIEIPVINVKLAVYHGTDEAVLQAGVGHLEWSALPIGGEGTHSVLSSHRGLPSARLFTDLPKLIVGDFFVIRVLNEQFTYEVDQILTVLPHETQALMPEAGKDYCTLVTCTPYGVNTHRLLVRGHRVPNKLMDASQIQSNAVRISTMLVAVCIAVPILVVLFILTMVLSGRRRGGSRII